MERIEDAQKFGKVAVAMGGKSAEREISLMSGEAVYKALQAQGVDVTSFDTDEQHVENLKAQGVDRVFNIMHGRGGEDGQLQGSLDMLNIPYTGSGLLGSALGMDKQRTKLCWRGAGIPTPAWMLLQTKDDLLLCAKNIGFPVIVKPSQEGSSIGMAKANNNDQLKVAFEQAATFDCDVIAEQWVEGGEYTVAILGQDALPVIKLETPHAFYDYEAKYKADSTQYHCPCGLSLAQESSLQQLALKAFDVLGGSGWGRVDLMLDTDGEPWLLEINTVPGMTDHSLVPMAAKQAGISFDELVWQILEISMDADKVAK